MAKKKSEKPETEATEVCVEFEETEKPETEPTVVWAKYKE